MSTVLQAKGSKYELFNFKKILLGREVPYDITVKWNMFMQTSHVFWYL